jgi:hypothetical protein
MPEAKAPFKITLTGTVLRTFFSVTIFIEEGVTEETTIPEGSEKSEFLILTVACPSRTADRFTLAEISSLAGVGVRLENDFN